MTSARSASALPTKATPPLPLAVGDSPETPFSTKKVKNGGGKSQKCKGFFWWGAARLAVLGGVATSALCAKMGSSEFKKSLQVGRNEEIIARMGDFFFGCAERKPRVFLGGDLKLPTHKCVGFCLFSG